MKTHQAVNQLLTAVSVAIKQRHLPELAAVVKQAGVLINSVHTMTLEEIDEKVAQLVKDFEAKLVAGSEVTEQDLVMESAEPAVVEEEDFTPLPNEVEEATLDVPDPTKKPAVKDYEADAELEEEDLLSDLDAQLDEEDA